MELNVINQNGKKTLVVEGRIDTTTAPDFEKKLLAELKEGKDLKVDMGNVNYVSSAGLRAFLNGQKYCNQAKLEMLIFNVNDTVMEVFEMTGFADILTLE